MPRCDARSCPYIQRAFLSGNNTKRPHISAPKVKRISGNLYNTTHSRADTYSLAGGPSRRRNRIFSKIYVRFYQYSVGQHYVFIYTKRMYRPGAYIMHKFGGGPKRPARLSSPPSCELRLGALSEVCDSRSVLSLCALELSLSRRRGCAAANAAKIPKFCTEHFSGTRRLLLALRYVGRLRCAGMRRRKREQQTRRRSKWCRTK